MTPLTPSEWDLIQGKARWDVLVALRGPDARQSDVPKWFSSSVIRGKLRDVMRVGGMINTDLNLVVLVGSSLKGVIGGMKSIPPVAQWDAEHFCGHIQEAAEILGIPCAFLPPEMYVDVMSSPTWRVAAEKMVLLMPTLYGLESAVAELQRHLGQGE